MSNLIQLISEQEKKSQILENYKNTNYPNNMEKENKNENKNSETETLQCLQITNQNPYKSQIIEFTLENNNNNNEENQKEIKFDNYSTEESKNEINNNNNLNNPMNKNSIENLGKINNNNNKNLSEKISKEKILKGLFTCKICENILYSPFICKNCGETACYSCFSKCITNKNKEDNNSNYKKCESKKNIFCRFCKNDNVNVMPNFKILRLKEDMTNNYNENYKALNFSELNTIENFEKFFKFPNDEIINNENDNIDLNSHPSSGERNIKNEKIENKQRKIEEKYDYLQNNNNNNNQNFNNFNNFNNPFSFINYFNPFNFQNFINNNNNIMQTQMQMQGFYRNNNINNITNNNNLSEEYTKNLIISNSKFFIIKSVYRENIILSKKFNIWATTPFNETKLRESFKKNFIILIFNQANISNFFGCALIKEFRNKPKNPNGFSENNWRNDRGIHLGFSFPIKWLSDCEIPIYKLKTMNNPLNRNLPILKGKDCQEIPNSIGSYIFNICENFSNKMKEEISYKEIYERIMNI